MLKLSTFQTLSAAILASTINYTAKAEPFIDAIPADAQFYIGWDYFNAPGYDSSHAAAVADLTLTQPITAESLRAQMENILALFGDEIPMPPELLETISTVYADAIVNGGAMYIQNLHVDPQNGPVPPTFVLMWRSSDSTENEATIENLEAIIQEFQAPFDIQASEDGMLRIILGDSSQPWDFERNTLVSNQRYRTGTRGLGSASAMTAWVDIASFTQYGYELEAFMTEQGFIDDNTPSFADIDQAFGLSGIDSFVICSSYSNGEWTSGFNLTTDGRATGLLEAVLNSEGIQMDTLQYVPATANSFAAFSFDVSSTLNSIVTAMAEFAPEVQDQYDQGLQSAEKETGIDIERMLEGFGHQWLTYSDPMGGGNGILGLVIENHMDQPSHVADGLLQSSSIINALLADSAEAEDLPFNPRILTEDTAEGTIRRFSLPVISPNYIIDGNRFIFGLSPQATRMAVRDNDPLMGKDLPRNTFAELDISQNANLLWLSYNDLASSAPYSYGNGLGLMQLAGFYEEILTSEAANMQMPPLQDLLPHLTPSAMAIWHNNNGISMRSTTPFAGAQIVTQGIGTSVITGATGAAIGFSIPALSQARSIAREMAEEQPPH